MTRLATAQRDLVPAGREGGSEGSQIVGRLNELPNSVDQSPTQALVYSPQDEALDLPQMVALLPLSGRTNPTTGGNTRIARELPRRFRGCNPIAWQKSAALHEPIS